jgi:hypothetical protein
MSTLRDRLGEQTGRRPVTREITTSSMWPAIRPGDSVRFRRRRRRPRLGEIWVAEQSGRHIAHRVLWVKGSHFLLKGDWSPRTDGWLPRAVFFGPVDELCRDGAWRPTNQLRDRLLGLASSAIGTWVHAGRRLASLMLGEERTAALLRLVRRGAH